MELDRESLVANRRQLFQGKEDQEIWWLHLVETICHPSSNSYIGSNCAASFVLKKYEPIFLQLIVPMWAFTTPKAIILSKISINLCYLQLTRVVVHDEFATSSSSKWRAI